MELRCLECIPDWCVECPVLAARPKRCQCGNERRRETRSVVALSDVAIVAVRRLQQKLRNHFFGRGEHVGQKGTILLLGNVKQSEAQEETLNSREVCSPCRANSAYIVFCFLQSRVCFI